MRRIVGADGFEECGVHPVQIEVRHCGTGRFAGTARRGVVDRFDESVDGGGGQETGKVSVGSHVDDADPVVCVEHRDTVARRDSEPLLEWLGVTGVQCVEHEGRQREVVDPVDLSCDLDLVSMV
jgi:hypothetical protein